MGTTFFGSDNGQVWQCVMLADAVRVFTFRFDRIKEIVAGATLTGAPVLTVVPSGPTLGSPAINFAADAVEAQISGATAGVVYRLECSCSATDGSTLTVYGDLKVM